MRSVHSITTSASRSPGVQWALLRWKTTPYNDGNVRGFIKTCIVPIGLFAEAFVHVHAAPVSFRNDVMPIISKAGCNLGTCHGNATGKGGFKLSLREDDPEFDFRALARDAFGRRIDTIHPERSLILRKPTQQLAHEGGRRFEKDSWQHKIVRQWIVEGAKRSPKNDARLTRLDVSPREVYLREPASALQIKAEATFSDGSKRDVSRVAVYEPAQLGVVEISPNGLVTRKQFGEVTVLVRYQKQQLPVRIVFVPRREDFAWSKPGEANFVDHFVFDKLKRLRINPSELCSDHVFLRRVHLDLCGVLPTAEAARAFAESKDRNKRNNLVELLLASPEFADYWTLKWADLLKVEDRRLDPKGMRAFHNWILESIRSNKPLDQFAREIVSASGSTYETPPANFYRANRTSDLRARDTAQVFLGTRLQCAQCHNHPFDRWTQDDYYDWAGVFGRIDYKILKNRRTDRSDKSEFKGEQVVYLKEGRKVTNPRTDEPARPRLLGEEKSLKAENELTALGDWLASAGNLFFARAQANRIWYHLMGRGLVEPLDDFRDTNPASHPRLLRALSDELSHSGFDLRHLIATIMASRAYQLSSTRTVKNADDSLNYSHTVVRRVTAEQLLDSQHRVAGLPLQIPGYPEGLRFAQLPLAIRQRYRDRSQTDAEKMLELFGKPKRALVCEYERSQETTMSQALAMISGKRVNGLITSSKNILSRLLDQKMKPEVIIDELFWTSLSRAPSQREIDGLMAHMKKCDFSRRGYEDILWSLLNAKEFIFRH